ncbi:periplasmic binding protein-like I [Blastocladiella britannica]|nr:periplasmic binding protein-like I [Blastocladiella britannica]
MTPPHLCLHFVWLALTVIWIGHGFAAATTGSPIADLMAACRQCTRRSEITIPMICHSDWVLSSFWVSVASGITKATQLYNISAVLQRPTVIGPANEAALVSLAASNYSLIGTTVVDMDNVGSAVARVVANGSAVVTYNSGNMYIDRDGAMNHIGQTEYNAGFKLGARLATLGARQIYCLNQEIGDTSLAARCQGARDGAVSVNPSASVTLTYLDGTSNPSMIATINGLLDAHPNLDGFASLDQDMAIRTTAILAQRNLLGTVKVGTVDIGQGVLQQIQQGNISFAIDQQEVLQGFGTMLLLKTFYMTRGQMLLTKELLSGPAVVSSANVPQVMCRVDPTHPGCALTLPASITIGVVSLNSWTLTSAVTKQLQYGAMNAAREHGVKLLFIDTGIFDLQALALQVQAAVNAGSISALVMPIPSVSSGQDYGALADLAAAASIPVFSYGTGAIRGAPKVASGSIKFHLGQDESVSGARVGARLNAIMAPGTQVLCLSLELGSDDMQLKCAGTQTALSDGRSVAFQSGSGSLVLMLSPRDSGLSHATLSAALATNPNIGAIVFPNAETARTVVNVLAATTHATRASSIVIAGYGVNLDVMELIHAGTVAFTVDEQPFLQAYLGTAFAAYYLTDNLVLQNGLLETGPQFIDQSTLQSAICRADTDADPMAECPACPPLCSVNGRCLDSGICQCNSGWLFGPNADCQLKDPGLQFIAASSTIALTMICFCGAAVLVTLGCTVLIFRFRAIPIIKASSWGMEMIMQFGFALVYASPFLYIGPPTDVTCLLQPYILSIGFSIAIAPLLAKTLRIYILFHQVFHSRVMGSGRIFRTMAGIVVMVNLMICTAWAVLDRPLPTREAIAPGKTNMVCQSASGSVMSAHRTDS